MTCEILVMNRHAVTLAADSTVTVSQWVNGVEEKRYFKSVNKVFQISKNRPVAMMVYGSGDLQQAPWELLAKEYRTHLADKSFDSLEQYGLDLFTFLKDSVAIFPKEYQDELFKDNCEKAAFVFFVQQINQHNDYKTATDDAARLAFTRKYLQETIVKLDKEGFISNFEDNDIEEAKKLFLGPLEAQIKAWGFIVDEKFLAEFAIKAIIKQQLYMGETGIVLAGFGDKNYFPGYSHYKCFGNILGKVAFKKEDGFAIDYHTPSHIKAFATTNMVDTFQFGIGYMSYVNASNCCEESLKDLVTKLGKDKDAGVPKLIQDEVSVFRDKLMQKCREQNYEPLTRVVAALPVDDMAELAETLVTLESLKEKVTQPTESVGGPVDVATITRGDGLVWIKRKHYFNPELNPRYFQRHAK